MRGFLANSKGAMTVFATLLLIPAILASGTAVDLARIHTARSIIQDANQLAANAALSQYDRLANELYGLFGIMAGDPQIEDMVNECIEASIFGEGWTGGGLGSFQLFYGSAFGNSEISFEKDKNLGNADVLRRQIEEYMKFRGPVVISREFFGVPEKNTIGEDLEIIKDKMAIDEFIGEISEKYKELHNAALEADKCKSAVGTGSFGSVSASLVAIQEQFINLKSCHESWQNAADGSDEKMKYEEKCAGILEKIRQLASGGSPRLNTWTDGKRNAAGAWVPGHWTLQGVSVVGLINNIANAKNNAENFKDKFKTVADIAKQIDGMKSELGAKIDALEQKLQTGACDEGLKNGILDKTGASPDSLVERYRKAVSQDVEPLAKKYQLAGDRYIDEVKKMLDDLEYRDADALTEGLAPSELAGISLALVPRAAYFADFADVTYHLPPGFIKFSGLDDKGDEVSGWEENAAFFAELQDLIKGAGGKTINFDGLEIGEKKDAEKKQREITEDFMKIVEEAYKIQLNDPKGAKYVGAKKIPGTMDFAISEIFKVYEQGLEEGLIDVFSDPEKNLRNAGGHVLPLAYGISMFSNYATAKPGESEAEKSISGIPLGPDVNYFYQSEWEYIYNGDESAEENLEAVAKLLFAARLIFNYISVFEIPEITEIVSSVQEAFSGFPLLGVELGELARLAFAAAESVADLAALRGGYMVPLVKKSHEWVCLPGVDPRDAVSNIGDHCKNKSGIAYSTYMIFFFIAGDQFKGGELIVERAAQLIEWNMINYKNRLKADEAKMSGELAKAGRFGLDMLKTDFRITTVLDMRMLFLSMPFAQKGINGIVPPKTMQFSVSDYRGY